MMFFTGMHQPSDAGRVPAAFISAHRLQTRRKPVGARRWIMDCGGFSTILLHGGYPHSPGDYAAEIRRWSSNQGLLAAVSQDYVCESVMLARTGLTIDDHQRLTIQRYDATLAAGTGGVYLMPVLQGYAPADYVEHVRSYGPRLGLRAWVGVGSVCKRNSDPSAIEEVLLAIKRERPDLRLHGFGLKITALASGLVRKLLFSADSMAWSYAARKQGRDSNSWREARRFGRRVVTMPVQYSLWGLAA